MTPEETKWVEGALAAFAARPALLNRDRLMFLAGRASAKGSGFGVHGSKDGDQTSETRGRRSGETNSNLQVPSSKSADGTRRSGAWPAATGILAATTLALAVSLFVRPAPEPLIIVRERVVRVPSETLNRSAARDQVAGSSVFAADRFASPADNVVVPQNNYLRTRDVVLRMGMEALGSAQFPGDRSLTPLSYRTWLEGQGATAGRAELHVETVPQM